jgi:hypothetical protein
VYKKERSDGFIGPSILFKKVADDDASAEECEEYRKCNYRCCAQI